MLAITACLFYVFVYTLWLKRTSSRNIVIGGAAGAVPVLIGWTAVTGQLAWAPVVLFAVIFYWTPPHFWALAIRYKDDYAAADVPMLPVGGQLPHHGRADPPLHAAAVGPDPALRRRWATSGVIYLGSAVVLGRRVHLPGRPGAAHRVDQARHAAVHLLDHLRDPAVRGDGGRRPRAPWRVNGGARSAPSNRRDQPLRLGFQPRRHAVCRVLFVPRSGPATPVTDHASLAPGVRSGVSVTTRSSLH